MPRVTDEAVIIGLGETPVGKLPGLNSVQIQAMAVHDALRSCGLSIRDVDGLINLDPYSFPNSMFATTLAEYLGLKPSFCTTVDVGGTVTGMTMLQQAIWAINSGHCRTAVCVYGENALTGRSPGAHGYMLKNLLGGEEWEEPFGLQGMVSMYALLAQRYFHDYGADESDLGAIAVSTREHALLNPTAMMKKPMTLEDHRRSRIICSPLRLLDCSLVADGGGALVLTGAANARRLGAPMVRMRSFAMRMTHNTVAQMPDIEDLGMRDAGRDAYEAAGIGPEDLDMAQLHDAFTISVLVTIDALGFCEPGGAGDYIRTGATAPGGKCPVNTHGGLLSQAHIGGMLHLVEAVRQLRGEAGRRQVPDARLALVSGNGGIFSLCGVSILERV
ncbi:MAG: thiolase family protein [Betaproteobacteria bacterium]|nr:MAG: thiolase family protein [Betaproteobacteria bacterium]